MRLQGFIILGLDRKKLINLEQRSVFRKKALMGNKPIKSDFVDKSDQVVKNIKIYF